MVLEIFKTLNDMNPYFMKELFQIKRKYIQEANRFKSASKKLNKVWRQKSKVSGPKHIELTTK